MTVRPSTNPTLAIEASKGAKADGEASAGEPIRFRFRMDRLLQELTFTDSFPLIFIAKPEGTVLYEESLDRRRWLRYLRWGTQTPRDAQASRSSAVAIQDFLHVLGGKDVWDRQRATNSRTSGSWEEHRTNSTFTP